MERAAGRRRDPREVEELPCRQLPPAEKRMSGPAGDDVPPGQDLAEAQPRALVEDVDRADREVDAVGMEGGAQLRQVAVGLVDPDVGMRRLEFGDHAGDERVHEERRAADPHQARLPLAKTVDQLRRLP